jgi:protein-S-isoprenylcysteine O-methyltransferase Ste14
MAAAPAGSARQEPAAPGPKSRRPLLRHPFRRKTARPRTLALYVIGIAALALARPSAWLFAPGIALVAVGQALRLWATGYLLKTDELTTAGPYAYLRHPLYAGALLMGSGFALMGGPRVAAVVLPIGLAFYFGYYLRYKERVEAERLEALYGDAFRAYRAAVPALVPRIRAWHGPRGEPPPPWRFERVIENDEQTALLYTALASLSLLAIGVLRAS